MLDTHAVARSLTAAVARSLTAADFTHLMPSSRHSSDTDVSRWAIAA